MELRTKRPLRARLFDALHARTLVYVTCWEDPVVDRRALEITADDHVLTIASGGCNALHYLLDAPAAVHAVDVNPLQIALLEFRVAAIRRLDDDAVFALFGTGASPHATEMYQDAVRPELSSAAAQFWDRHVDWFSGRGWRASFIYRGSAGLIHKLLRDYAYRVRGLRDAIEAVIAAPTLEQQRAVYQQHDIRGRFVGPVLRRLISHPVTLAMLGIPDAQRAAIARHPEGVLGYALEAVENAFTRTRLTENYFWRGVLEGGYTRDCCPEYLSPIALARLRGGLLDRLHLHARTVTTFMQSCTTSISKLVLLDHMDWLATWGRQALADEWTAIVEHAPPGARVIFRSARPDPWQVESTDVQIGGRSVPLRELVWLDEERAATLHRQDRTCIYGGFHIAHLRQRS